MDELDRIQNEQINKLYKTFILIEETLAFHQSHNNISQRRIDKIRRVINKSIDKKIQSIKSDVMKEISDKLYDPFWSNERYW